MEKYRVRLGNEAGAWGLGDTREAGGLWERQRSLSDA